MNDRGMIKWAPFSAVVPGTYLVREIELEKHRIKKPCLDEDKVTEIEKSILEAYNNHDYTIHSQDDRPGVYVYI